MLSIVKSATRLQKESLYVLPSAVCQVIVMFLLLLFLFLNSYINLKTLQWKASLPFYHLWSRTKVSNDPFQTRLYNIGSCKMLLEWDIQIALDYYSIWMKMTLSACGQRYGYVLIYCFYPPVVLRLEGLMSRLHAMERDYSALDLLTIALQCCSCREICWFQTFYGEN